MLSPFRRQVVYALLTRSPLRYPLLITPFDLHVLGTPPAFVLSQDQTLQKIVFIEALMALNKFKELFCVGCLCDMQPAHLAYLTYIVQFSRNVVHGRTSVKGVSRIIRFTQDRLFTACLAAKYYNSISIWLCQYYYVLNNLFLDGAVEWI